MIIEIVPYSLVLQLGFGRSMPTNVLWVDNLLEGTQESYMKRQFSRNGPANYVVIDRTNNRALVFYDNNDLALAALQAMRGRIVGNSKIQVRDVLLAHCVT